MDPIQNALASMLNALQAASAAAALDVAAPQLPALLALVGQDVNLLFLGSGPEGPRLELPSGQAFSAQGELPYPDGTQLLVRILGGTPASGGLRLQTLEARPPQPAPILAPLLQGEGAALLARLGQADPGPGLGELAALYRTLKGEGGPPGQAGPGGGAPAPGAPAQPASGSQAPGSAPPPVPVGAGQTAVPTAAGQAPVPTAVGQTPAPPAGAQAPSLPPGTLLPPDPSQIQAALDRLPAPALATLKALFPPEPGGTLASALEAWLAQGAASPTPGRTPVQDLLSRFQAVQDRHPELPPAPALVPFLKALAPREAERRPAPASPRPEAPAPAASPALAAARTGPELPETWQSWIKTAVRTLGDPGASPREAPFHAAQAKEGTAFYELPLPWAPQSPLQIWVERDRKGRGGGGQEETRTILVGLNFSRLGETRLGVAKGPAGLQVRVWAEHVERLQGAREQIARELEAVDPGVDLRLLPLHPGPGGFVPSLRSLVTGPTMQMLG